MNYIILDTNIIDNVFDKNEIRELFPAEKSNDKKSNTFEFITLEQVATKIKNASDKNVFFYITNHDSTNHDNINSYGTLKLGENQKAHLDLSPKH